MCCGMQLIVARHWAGGVCDVPGAGLTQKNPLPRDSRKMLCCPSPQHTAHPRLLAAVVTVMPQSLWGPSSAPNFRRALDPCSRSSPAYNQGFSWTGSRLGGAQSLVPGCYAILTRGTAWSSWWPLTSCHVRGVGMATSSRSLLSSTLKTQVVLHPKRAS